MKRKYLQFSNKALRLAIFGLVGGMSSCNYLVKYGSPEPDPEWEVLYGPAPIDTMVCMYGVPTSDEPDTIETPITEEANE